MKMPNTQHPLHQLENWCMGKASLVKVSMSLKSSNARSLKKNKDHNITCNIIVVLI